MPRLQEARHVLSTGDHWATLHRTAITPSFLCGSPTSSGKSKNYDNYCKAVERARLERPTVGSRTLQDTAIESILANLHRMSYEALLAFSSHSSLLEKIWQKIERRQISTFDSWALFSKLLLKRQNVNANLFLYGQSISKPVSALPIYTTPLTSTSFEFITCLSITTAFPKQDLFKISSMKNLGTLELAIQVKDNEDDDDNYFTGVEDRMIRTWAEAALSDEKAFPILRILRVAHSKFLTHGCFQYLNAFPTLALFDVEGSAIDVFSATDTAERMGWQQMNPEEVSSRKKSALLVDMPSNNDSSKYDDYEAKKEVLDYTNTVVSSLHSRSSRLWMYSDFVEIGRRRNHEDFKEIGLQGGTKELHGQSFCETPTAVIRLGPENVVRNAKRMVFHRMDFGKERAAWVEGKKEKKKRKLAKRPADVGIRPSKKQSLGDMMGAFDLPN